MTMVGKIVALLSVAPALVAGSTACWPGCATCNSSSNTDCTSCDAGYTFDSTWNTCFETAGCYPGCATCNSFSYWDCTSCDAGYVYNSTTNTCDLIYYYQSDWNFDESHACHWGGDHGEIFYTKLIAGTIAGVITTAICVIANSLPVCCRVMKTNLSGLKMIGVVTGIVSAISIAIPAITGMVVGGQAVEEYCDGCGCDDNDREEAKNAIAALGVIVGYIHAFGFVVVILAIVALSLSCCLCCPCCGPLKAEKQKQVAGGAGVPQVLGQVVEAGELPSVSFPL